MSGWVSYASLRAMSDTTLQSPMWRLLHPSQLRLSYRRRQLGMRSFSAGECPTVAPSASLPRRFFSERVGIRTGNPVCGSFPTHSHVSKSVVNGFAAHQSAGDAYLSASFGGQVQCPETGVAAKGSRTLVQKGAHPFTRLRVKDLMGRVRARQCRVQCRQFPLVSIVHGVADGLLIAARALSSSWC
jgi:hypothetical protein